MKTKQWVFISVITLSLMLGSLYASPQYNQQNNQQSRNQQQGQMRHPPHPVMTVLDNDRDHVISAKEIANAAKALMTLDKNGDKMLSNDELRPKRRGGQQQFQQQGKGNQQQSGNHMQRPKGRNRQGPPPLPAMIAMDTDNNHQLSASEIANAPKTLLTLDKNKDGKLSHDEVRLQPSARGQQSRKTQKN